MSKNKFQVGDLITGTSDNLYGITNNEGVYKVIGMLEHSDGEEFVNDIEVEIISHQTQPERVGGIWAVESQYFQLSENKEAATEKDETIGNEEFYALTKTMTREEFLNEYQASNCPGEFNLKEDYVACHDGTDDCCQRCWEQAIKNATFKDDVINECTITAEQCTATKEYIKTDKPSEVNEVAWNDGEMELLEQYKNLVELMTEELEDSYSDFFKYLKRFRPELYQLVKFKSNNEF